MTDDFANEPKSVLEIRADKEGDGRIWTVRDMLISALREIDSGTMKADIAFLAIGHYTEEGSHTRFFAKGNHYDLVGVTHRALFLLDNS